MLASELLRKDLEETYNIDLEKYKWDEKLQEEIFDIDLDSNYEDESRIPTLKMKEIYEKGLNIGRCGLTSRYFARRYKNAKLSYGKCKLLVGTKNSINGSHAWIIKDGYIIDSTLMIKISLNDASPYYQCEKILAYDSARELPEYNCYSDDEIFQRKTK